MLARSLKIPPSAGLFIVFCFFLAWQLSHGPVDDVVIGSAASPPPPKDEEKPLRIALVTFVTGEKSYVHMSLKSKDHYARRHGLDFIVDYEAHTERGITWWKYDMMERLVRTGKWDWIWWLDFDTLITNTDIKVADIIEQELQNATNPDNIDYLLTHDCNGLNTGSFIVRGHERSIKFLRDIYAVADQASQDDKDLSEQDAMSRLIKNDEASARKTIQVPQWKLNAFPEEINCYDTFSDAWERGNFIIHFAGAWAHVKGEDPTGQLMRRYERHIVWGDWKDFY